MNLPWIARSTYEAVRDERDRLRDQVDRLLDAHVRIQRTEAGLPEVAAQKREAEPMPVEVRARIEAWSSEATKSKLWREAHSLYGKRGTWEPVLDMLTEFEERIA